MELKQYEIYEEKKKDGRSANGIGLGAPSPRIDEFTDLLRQIGDVLRDNMEPGHVQIVFQYISGAEF